MRHAFLLVLFALTCAPLAAQEAKDAASHDAELRFKVLRRWSLELPSDPWKPLVKKLEVAGGPEVGYRLRIAEGGALEVDVHGDGSFAGRFSGEEGTLAFGPKGSPRVAALRVRKGAGGWACAAGGARQGKLAGQRIRLIDANLNGRYDDFGTDAMVLGSGSHAIPLSRAIVLDGRLFGLEVAADGSQVSAKPWSAPVGTLDGRSAFDCKARLLWGVLSNTDGSVSFDLAEVSGALTVPVGRYHLVRGQIGQGSSQVSFRGSARSVEVEEGARAEIAWGGPLQGSFEPRRRGGDLVIDPRSVRYVGKFGEEYHGWTPLGKSPKFILTSLKTGKEVATAFFPGSC